MRRSGERVALTVVVLETGDDEVVDLARDGPTEAVPGDARWDVFAGAPRGWLGHAKVDKPVYPPYYTAGLAGGSAPSTPEPPAPKGAKSRNCVNPSTELDDSVAAPTAAAASPPPSRRPFRPVR